MINGLCVHTQSADDTKPFLNCKNRLQYELTKRAECSKQCSLSLDANCLHNLTASKNHLTLHTML
jgi:hypothetical protein